jgi:nucleoid-associated protein YejK
MNSATLDLSPKKVLFTISYLRGTAYKWIEPYLTDFLENGNDASSKTKSLIQSFAHFKEQLRLVFGNVDEKRFVDRELHSLRQKTSASDYAVNF